MRGRGRPYPSRRDLARRRRRPSPPERQAPATHDGGDAAAARGLPGAGADVWPWRWRPAPTPLLRASVRPHRVRRGRLSRARRRPRRCGRRRSRSGPRSAQYAARPRTARALADSASVSARRAPRAWWCVVTAGPLPQVRSVRGFSSAPKRRRADADDGTAGSFVPLDGPVDAARVDAHGDAAPPGRGAPA